MTMVKTGIVKAMWVQVFEPATNKFSGREEYSLSVLVPKSDTQTIKALMAAFSDVIKTAWPKGKPANLELPLRDGDKMLAKDGSPKPAYAGHFYINAKKQPTFGKPQIVDADLNPVMSKDEFRSGSTCRLGINVYPYYEPKPGLGLGLELVQVIEARGERYNAETFFSE